jgi:hypothetical protein
MNVRFSEAEIDALRAQAEAERRSMQEVARAAVREYVSRRTRAAKVSAELEFVTTAYAEALRELGER